MRELSGIGSDEALWTRWLSCRWVQPLRGRRCTPEEFAAGMVADWELDLEPAAFLRAFGGWPEPSLRGALELVAAVQATVPAGFLSNMNAFQWEANYEGIPLTEAFDYRFLSFELGLVKPDRAIFDAVAARLPVPRRPGALPRRQRGQRGGGRGRRLRRPARARRRRRPGRARRPRACSEAEPSARPHRREAPVDGALCQHAAMVANGPMLRLLPRLSDDVAFFWTSGEDGVLRLLRCNACGFFIHPPGPVCPRCLSRDLGPQEVSGRGHVETFTVNYQQWIPGSDPYIIAWVSIDEQPDVRLTTNLVDVEPDDVRIGMPVRVRLRARRGRLAPALHARRRTRREPASGRGAAGAPGHHLGHRAVGRGAPAGALRPRPDGGGGLVAIADAGLTRDDIDGLSTYPGMGAGTPRVRRPDHARGPGRPGPVPQLARRRGRGRRRRCAP